MKQSLLGLLLLSNAACSTPASKNAYAVDVWADNWFSLTVNGELVGEDSVPITTERSFNSESFTFSAEPPFVLGLTAKDFKENDTGLEYIGTPRQQMGDGGVILQVRSDTGELVAATDAEWKCLVIHAAPTDKSCERDPNPQPGEGSCGYTISAPPAG